MEHPENDPLYKGLKVNKGLADFPTVNPYLKRTNESLPPMTKQIIAVTIISIIGIEFKYK